MRPRDILKLPEKEIRERAQRGEAPFIYAEAVLLRMSAKVAAGAETGSSDRKIERAASLGYGPALHALAVQALRNERTADDIQVTKWLQQAIPTWPEAGLTLGVWQSPLCLTLFEHHPTSWRARLTGWRAKKGDATAFNHIVSAVAAGASPGEGYYQLALRRMYGIGTRRNWVTGSADLRTAMQHSHIQAYYFNGALLERVDKEAALASYMAAADKGHPPSQHIVGVAILDGGLELPTDEALVWLRRAAAQDWGPSQALLSDLYQEEWVTGTPGGSAKAVNWAYRAWEHGLRSWTQVETLAARYEVKLEDQASDTFRKLSDKFFRAEGLPL